MPVSIRQVVPALLFCVSALPAVEPSPNQAPPLSVSATRLEADPLVQPYTYHTYSGDTLQAENTGRKLDALANTPGVAMQRTAGNQASPYLRGLTGQQTLLLFDGVRLNHAGMRSGPNQYAALVPDEAIGRADVILGSGTTVLGSDALTGALDLRLAQAGRGVTSNVSPWGYMRAASAEGGQFQGGIDGKLGNWDYSLDGGYIEQHEIDGGTDAWKRLTGVSADDQTIPNSGFHQESYGARVAYTGLARNRFEVSGGRVRQYDAPRADGYAANSGNAARLSRSYDPQVFDYLHLRHIVTGLGPVARLQSTVWFHQHLEDQEREDINGAGAAARYRRRVNTDEIRTFGGDVQFTHHLANHEITWGGTTWEDVTRNGYEQYRSPTGSQNPNSARLDATADSNPGSTTLPDGSRWRGTGFFAQDSWTFVPRWTLLAGLRWDRAAWELPVTPDRPGYATYGGQGVSEAVSAVTAQGRLAWNPYDPLLVYTGVGQGFRAPTLSDLAGQQDRASTSSGGAGPQTQGNPDLDPERSMTYEIGTKWEQDHDSASLALFRTDLQDLITVEYIDVNGDGRFTAADSAQATNAAEGQLLGGEVANDVGLPFTLPERHRLALFQSTSLVSGEAEVPQNTLITRTEHISRANQIFGKAGVRYGTPDSWWFLGQVRWAGAYDEVAPGDATDTRHTTAGGPDGSMPGWAILDVKAGWRAPDGSLGLDAGIENLGDVTYRQVGSGIDGAGTNFVVAGQARF